MMHQHIYSPGASEESERETEKERERDRHKSSGVLGRQSGDCFPLVSLNKLAPQSSTGEKRRSVE